MHDPVDRRRAFRFPRRELRLDLDGCPGWPALLRITVIDWGLAGRLAPKLLARLDLRATPPQAQACPQPNPAHAAKDQDA